MFECDENIKLGDKFERGQNAKLGDKFERDENVKFGDNYKKVNWRKQATIQLRISKMDVP